MDVPGLSAISLLQKCMRTKLCPRYLTELAQGQSSVLRMGFGVCHSRTWVSYSILSTTICKKALIDAACKARGKFWESDESWQIVPSVTRYTNVMIVIQYAPGIYLFTKTAQTQHYRDIVTSPRFLARLLDNQLLHATLITHHLKSAP